MKQSRSGPFKYYLRNLFQVFTRWKSFSLIISVSMSLIAVFAVISITLVLNRRFNQSLNMAGKNSNTRIVNNIKDSISSYLDEMEMLSERVKDLLTQEQETVNQAFGYEFIMRKDINTIAVFGSDGQLILKSNDKPFKSEVDITEENWFNYIAPGSNIIRYTQPHVQRLYDSEYPWVISLLRGVEYEEDGNKMWGIMLVDMNFASIKSLCETEVGEQSTIYILDEWNNVIFHPRQQMLYAGIEDETITHIGDMNHGTKTLSINDQKYVICVSKIRSNGWKVVGVSQLNGISYYDRDITRFIILIVLGMTLIIIIVTNMVSHFLIRPIKKLIRLMVKAENGNLSVIASNKGYQEITELSNSFNSMIDKIKALMDNIVKEQVQLRKSEMKTLYTQINSHFLYNTLDSIIWLSESGENASAVKMLAALAQFFRLSLSGGKDMITVEEEIEHVRNYLIIQKMRYNEQFDYIINVPDEVKGEKTLKMVLQPIVENSIIHGVSRLPDQGEIKILADISEGMLVFTISDNGFGIPPEKLADILNSEASKKSGIGIKNVNSRIQLVFGTEYGLEYDSELDKGTTVRVRLPAREDSVKKRSHLS